MSRSQRFVVVLSVFALLSLAPAVAEVTIADIGTINGRQSAALGVNAAGDACGLSFVTGTIGEPNGPPAEPFLGHAVLYSDGVLTDLGALEGYGTCSPLGCESRGIAINDAGWIAGWNDGDNGPIPILWLPEAIPGYMAGFNVLPRLAEYGAYAISLNDHGLVVGRSSAGPVGPRAVAWRIEESGPQIFDLGTLRADNDGYGIAYDVNELGQIVGEVSDENFISKPFLLLPEPAYGLPAGMNNLLPGNEEYARAWAINAHGEIAGEQDLGVPWIWLPAPAYGLPAGFSLLTMPRDILGFFPTDISDAGQIVGQAFVQTNPHTRDYVAMAAMWRNGTWKLLDKVLPKNSPWQLIYAESVVYSNKTTRIAGYGGNYDATDINGFVPASRGYVLTVTCTGDLNEDGDVDQNDLAIQREHLGQIVTPGTNGDLDGDGDVDARDIPLLGVQVGQPCL